MALADGRTVTADAQYLHDSILPTRQRADLILKKSQTHRVEEVALRRL